MCRPEGSSLISSLGIGQVGWQKSDKVDMADQSRDSTQLKTHWFEYGWCGGGSKEGIASCNAGVRSSSSRLCVAKSAQHLPALNLDPVSGNLSHSPGNGFTFQNKMN